MLQSIKLQHLELKDIALQASLQLLLKTDNHVLHVPGTMCCVAMELGTP